MGKNKILRTIFSHNKTLIILEQNYIHHQTHSFEDENNIDSGNEILSGKISKDWRDKSSKKINSEFKELILSVINDHGFGEMRSAKMEQNGFLRLLTTMNSIGTHYA